MCLSCRTLIISASTAALLLLTTQPAQADAVYKRSRWASRLVKASLQVQGTGFGSWGKRWITVATGVKSYREVGTSKGPVLIYTKGKRRWHVVQLHFNTGARLNQRNFSKPVTLMRRGRFGALIQVGKVCYDYSWRTLRKMDCKTRRYK
ncbi:MAG: hypothetical protein JRH20_26045 [Deltaproteobacteria bacterium]|nr:hypothetical protein [Deltaproteobacteria bacterium]